jgi:hypothetical protein
MHHGSSPTRALPEYRVYLSQLFFPCDEMSDFGNFGQTEADHKCGIGTIEAS